MLAAITTLLMLVALLTTCLLVVPAYLTLSYSAMLRSGVDIWWVRVVGRECTHWVLRFMLHMTRSSTSYLKIIDRAAKKVGAAGCVQDGSVCFAGGSEFAYWRFLSRDLVPLVVCNVSVGGSRMQDSVRHVDLVVDRNPRLVVYSCGVTDLITFGRDAQSVLVGFQVFVETVRQEHRRVPILFVGIPSSPFAARVRKAEAIGEANALSRSTARPTVG